MNHAYVVYEIWKCNDDIREEGDPECKGLDEINEWISMKSLSFKYIDIKVDFEKREEEHAIRQSERWFP